MDDSDNILPLVIQSTVTNDHDNQQIENIEYSTVQNRDNQRKNVRNLFCFWTIGLCNDFGSTVMFAATFDILKRLNEVSVRSCYLKSFRKKSP